jgi:hypothetical protein
MWNKYFLNVDSKCFLGLLIKKIKKFGGGWVAKYLFCALRTAVNKDSFFGTGLLLFQGIFSHS